MTRLPDIFLSRPIAHRGLHDRASGIVENSLSALRAAAAAGYGAELDVQISADGRAMVFHDDDLDRLTAESGPVRARQADALARLRLGEGGDLIPALPRALEALGPETPVLVEIKRQAPEIGVGPLEAAVAEALAAHAGPAAVMSFDPRVALWFRDHAPEVPRGLVSMDFTRADGREGDEDGLSEAERRELAELAAFDPAQADFVSYGWRDLPRPETEALRARGVPVLCWTTRSPEEDAAARRHADNVTFEGYRPETPRPR